MAEYKLVPFERLQEQFGRLPGIGPKTAARLAYYVLTMPQAEAEKFADAVVQAHKTIRYCKVCCNMTDQEICPICSDPKRDKSVICVVESLQDVLALEKTRELNITYHVLHGLLSPMKGIMPDMLSIKELMNRLKDHQAVKEVIMATNPTIEGEATAMYLSKLIKPLGVRVSRLAYGIPVGCNLEYTDEVTLTRAIHGRSEM